MSDPFGGPAPPPGGPPRSTPLGAPPPGSPYGSQPGYGTPPPGFGAQPPGYGQPPVAQPQWAQPPRAQGTNGLAIAAFVLGLLWLCAVGSLLGVIFGFVGLAQIKSSDQKGRGLAIAGIVLGLVGIVGTIVGTIVIVNRAEEVLEQVPSEVDDVTLVGCGENAAGRPEAQLSITNDSSKPSTYVIIVEFTGGGSTVSSELTGFEVVDPDKTVEISVAANQALSGSVDCDITYVQRLANTGGTQD